MGASDISVKRYEMASNSSKIEGEALVSLTRVSAITPNTEIIVQEREAGFDWSL